MGILDKLFNFDKKRLNEIENKANQIDLLQDKYHNLSDQQLKEQTQIFKDRLNNNETLDDILIDAFACIREAAKRVINEYPYLVQIMGAITMHNGDIAEMKTGEGKTLTSVLTIYLNALLGKGIHVVTVNEYLALRDSKWMGQIFEFMGLTVACNIRGKNEKEKKHAYLCDITYTTNSELAFDYLRDNMVTNKDARVMRGLHFALIDEVDSILIDESRTPLIISGPQKDTATLYKSADNFVKSLSLDKEYNLDIKTRSIYLTDEGVLKAQKLYKVDNLYHIDNTILVHHINLALKANYIMTNEVEYVIEDKAIVIVDQFTGRKMHGRVFSDGLHRALEAKERLPINNQNSTMTLASITYQNFFRLYNKLAGMTGTAKTEEEEFLSVYNMRVLEIPTNSPIKRIDYDDAIYGSKKSKFNALVNEIINIHQKQQPILVGTISVETSEHISKMLKTRKIPHEVLNAKNHAREAEIIAKAGKKNSITIATNMAGRGTDIKLGEGVKELGGLAVLGSERHESRRIDNQLRGRSGRQGDVGFSRFYVSIEDDLVVRFAADRMKGLFSQLADDVIESKVLTKTIATAQKRVEGHNFDTRKALLGYDDVLRQQREIIYQQRNTILDSDNLKQVIKDMFDKVISDYVSIYSNKDTDQETFDFKGFKEALESLGYQNELEYDYQNKNISTISNQLSDLIFNQYLDKLQVVAQHSSTINKQVILSVIDRLWINHIDIMSKLREGIHLRAYAQNNPLQEYTKEGFYLFDELIESISKEVVTFCLRITIQTKKRA